MKMDEKLKGIENNARRMALPNIMGIKETKLPLKDVEWLVEKTKENIELAVAYNNAQKEIMRSKNHNKLDAEDERI